MNEGRSSLFRQIGSRVLLVSLVTVLLLLSTACGKSTEEVAGTSDFESTVAIEWMELLCEAVRTEGLSPPQASRIYAYAGVTLYESVVEGMPDYQSLSGQLNGLPDMPQMEVGKTCDWPSSASAALAIVTEGLFQQATPETIEAIRQLKEQQLEARDTAGVPSDIVQYSITYGESVGNIILEWSSEDGYQDTRGLPYAPPSGPGTWEPTPPKFRQASEPYWGELRPFVLETADSCEPSPPIEYSEDPASEFYHQAWLVYEAVNSLDEEQQTIALYWSDNPRDTCTPPGHWLSIENQIVKTRHMHLDEAAEMYALVGIAMGDAFISCWAAKYHWNVLRPVTYIQNHIDAEWEPSIATPPFPEYTSGHSVVSGAASTVLEYRLGTVAFTDRTHDGLGFRARSFSSLDEAAQEAAISRLYGGIHYPMAIEEGLHQGELVGREVVERVITRPRTDD